MKKILFILCLLTATFISLPVYANEVNVNVNELPVVFTDQGPVIVDGRTLVPVAGVFQALGFDVGWNGDTRQATLTRGDDVVIITIDSSIFTVNGISHALDVPAQIIGGRTMIPIAVVLQSIGYYVNWDGATRTVLISGTTGTPVAITHQAPEQPVPAEEEAPRAANVTGSPLNIAESIIDSQGGIPGLISISYGSEYFTHHISEFYRINPADIRDGVIFFVDFSLVDDMPADEIAVFELTPAADTGNIADALRSYIRRRASEFAGYAPESAAVASRGIVVYRDNFIALIICYEPQTAESAFLSFFR